MPDGFGRFVLLGELETGWRGTEYRAAALAGTEFERHVSLLQIAPALGESELLLEHLRVAARVGVPHAVAIHEIGRVEGTAFVASELVEGKSLRAVLARAREEAMPIAPDNALQVASRVAAALAYAHGHHSPEGAPFVHGMVGPDSVIVSYEGEVAVRGFGWWTSRAWQGHLPDELLRHLAPEQRGGLADPRSDVFGVGALLLQCLTGAPPDAPLGEARLPNGEPLASPVAEVLAKALNPDAAGRFADAYELRRALDALLFSGDFSPTTFNLAYFMYTLFRDTVEQEARVLKRERQASYADHVREVPHQEEADEAPHAETRGAHPAPTGAAPVHHAAPSAHHPAVPAPHAAPPTAKAPAGRPAARVTGPRPAQTSRDLAVKLGVGALLLAAVAAGYFLFFLRAPAVPAPTPVPTLPPQEVAALARVRELEARLKAIEEEKAQAEAAAAEEARQRLQAEATRKGRAVDRAVVARAEEEAARLARAEQDRRQEAEKKRIAEEMRAEEARLAAARAAATPGAAPTPSTALTPTPEPRPPTQATAVATAVDLPGPAASEPPTSAPPGAAAPPTTAPSTGAAAAAPPTTVPAGAPAASVVHAADEPGVTPPVLQKAPPVEYPQLARGIRVEGVVVVSALVDEKGRVSEAKAVTPGNQILRDAAVAHVLQRRYFPGKKDGVAVSVRINVQVAFKFQR